MTISAYGYGLFFVITTGIDFLNSFACGLETMVSHAYGANKIKLCSDLYYRSIYFNVYMIVPMAILMFNSGFVLSFIFK